MNPRRRTVLGGLCAGAAVGFAPRARAAPVLSAKNYGVTAASAPRHNAWLEIDALQFERNIDSMKAMLAGGRSEFCAILKADAYGHGMSLLMPSVLKARLPWIGVSSNDEARIARDMGFVGRVLRVRSAGPEEIEDGLVYRMEEIIGNADSADLIAARLARRGRRLPLRAHFVLNADGMSRNGLELKTDYGKAEARRILAVAHLKFVGLMTHYPTDDLEDVHRQLARFHEDAAWLVREGFPTGGITRHTANSFATLHTPDARLDLVRVGGALYGDQYDGFKQFLPIMTMKSRVVAINHLPIDETVSYDRTFKLERESWLANVPVGYSDGYRRTLSHANQGSSEAERATHTQVLIDGTRFPVVGRVTMNTVMVDVTGHQDRIHLDDEVVLYGRQGSDSISLEETERNAGTYGPDFYTVWGNSLPKVLKKI